MNTFGNSVLGTALRKPLSRKSSYQILRDIYNEVVDPRSIVDKNFIKKEFFIDLDSNMYNKEEHVVVLNNWQQDGEKMLIQITYFEPKKENRVIKLAKETKKINCFLRGREIGIEQCDYTEKEMNHLLSKILNGIRNKKKLLKLIKD